MGEETSAETPTPFDPTRGLEPPDGPGARLLWNLVLAYRKLLSPFLGLHCRFEPSCSIYALQALRKHGVLRATALIVWRILRCNPLCRGGYDPP